MLQESGLPILTRVGELIELIRRLSPRPMAADEIVRRAGLAGLVERRTESLSGGEAQRVRFAMAIAGDPDLLFLDEPTVAMDVETRRAFWADMRAFAAEGRTILFATHYLEEADQVADRIVVLDHGRIVADGSAGDIKSGARTRRVRFELADADRGVAPGAAGRRAVRTSPATGRRSSRPTRTPPRGPCSRRASRSAISRSPDRTSRPRSSHSWARIADAHHLHPPFVGPRSQMMTALTLPAIAAVDPVRAMVAYLALEIRRAARNRRYLVFAIGFPVVFYLLYTGVLTGKNAPANPAWNAFFLVSMVAYGMIGASLSNAIPISQERASGWTRQLRITPLPASAWIATKLVVAYLTSLPALVLVSLAAVAINHVTLAPATWATIAVSLALGVLPFAGLGLLIGFTFEASAAQGAVTTSYIGLAILGGLWAPVSTFPDTLATIARIMPTYHFANLGWAAVAGFAPDLEDVLVLVAWSAVIFALVAWRYRVTEQRARG